MNLSKEAKQLRNSLNHLIKIFENRIRDIGRISYYNEFIKEYNCEEIEGKFREFFGEGDFKIIGIDGSLVQERRIEMLIFYVCAVGFYGKMEIKDHVKIDVSRVIEEEAVNLSASIPLWLEDISNIDPNFEYILDDFEIIKTIDSIPYALMTMSELKLAYDQLSKEDVKVIILDRTLSGTYGPTARDFRNLVKRNRSVICEIDTPYGHPSMLDVNLAGYIGPGEIHIPRRDPYIAYFAIKRLIEEARKGEEKFKKIDLPKILNVNEDLAKEALRDMLKLNMKYNGILLSDEGEYITLNRDVLRYWDRVWYATEKILNKIYNPGDEHPLLINGEDWITTLDLNTINLYLLYSIMSKTVKNGKLLIGIVKDTNSTDLMRSIIPYILTGKSESTPPRFRSDKALLSLISAINHEKIKVPWRTIEYDSFMATIIQEELDEAVEATFKAAREIIGREQFTLKGYFQLRSLKEDPSIRSNIFAYDRPIYPKYDYKMIKKIECMQFGEKISAEPIIELENDENIIGDIILHILYNSDNPNVLEEMGHNHLLFLADKMAKTMSKNASKIISGLTSLDLMTTTKKYKAYFIARRFRDIRSEIEHLREIKAKQI